MGICKCSNSGCPVRSTCYRWTAKANQRYQAYNAFKGEDCGYYWEVNEAKRMLGGNYDSN